MKGRPFCTNYRFVDIERDARRETGRTHALEGKREVWLRKAWDKIKGKKKNNTKY